MSGYALLDCGNGRRLEILGGVRVDRPAPAATDAPGLPRGEWASAELAFTREGGWRGDLTQGEGWTADFGPVRMGLRPAAGGQVGVFPEHAAVAQWVEERAARKWGGLAGRRCLNLFAHTGLGTLWLAGAGAEEVAHVDAAAAAVRAARENAALSGLAEARIRWLVDDAGAFLAREARRGRSYGIIMADPPAYGRAGKKEWRLDRDLPGLLAGVGGVLASESGALFCLTFHSEGWTGARAEKMVADVLPGFAVSWRELHLATQDGVRRFCAGYVVFAER